MKGVVFEKAGAEPQIVDNLEKPKPSPNQILVKSIYMAINPVDSYMSSTGLLVTAWPFVLGCDAAGVVVEVGDQVGSLFKLGDEVCGCTRLGVPGHSTAQEFFLMDAALTMKKPKHLSLQEAATLGVGTYTAALGLFNGLKIKMPDLDSLPDDESSTEAEAETKIASSDEAKEQEVPAETDAGPESVEVPKNDATVKATDDEIEQATKAETAAETKKSEDWVVVLGGSSSVGKYAIQLAKIAGYSVAASCSANSAKLVKDLGATPFDYKAPLDQQISEVNSITSNRPFLIFDAAATGATLAQELFKTPLPADDTTVEKLFTTTNDWSDLTTIAGGVSHIIGLGPIGRPEADTNGLNASIEKFIPAIVRLVETGHLLPNPYDIVGGKNGWQDVIEALRYQQKGAGGSSKVVVRVGEV